MDTAPLKAAVAQAIDEYFGNQPDPVPPAPPAPPPPEAPPPLPPAPAILTGLPFGFTPAYEAGIRTGNSPSLNAGRLNDLIAGLSQAGGGLIRLNEPGAIPIDNTITLMPGVSIRRENANRFAWEGPGNIPIFSSRPVDVLTDLDLDLYVDEGSAFASVAIRLHSMQNSRVRAMGYGNNTASTFLYTAADSTAGEFAGGGRNFVFNEIRPQHRGACGTFLLLSGMDNGYGNQPQGVTDCNFHNANACAVHQYFIRPEKWVDTICFSGNTYAGLGGDGTVGFINNPASPTVETGVYGIHFEHLAFDTFPGGGTNRWGVVLNAGKGFTCDYYMNLPEAEKGGFNGANAISYDFRQLMADNTLRTRAKGLTTSP